MDHFIPKFRVFIDENRWIQNIIFGPKIGRGRQTFYRLNNGQTLLRLDILNKEVYVECSRCSKKIKLIFSSNLMSKLYKKEYLCGSCCRMGNRNPFYNKNHNLKTKKKISNSLKGRFVGEKNPFFKKMHTKETVEKLSQKAKEWWESASIEQLEMIKDKISLSQKRMFREDPKKYSKLRQKAGRASHINQNQRYQKMNKIETLVGLELFRRNLNFEYSVIICRKQFDFGIRDKKVLIEVHGDYWHGNPKLFSEELVPNKRLLNDTQKKKIEYDKKKADLARKHNFRLIILWESEILKSDFSRLDSI